MDGTPISHRRKLRSSASLEERVCGLCAERSIDVKNVANAKTVWNKFICGRLIGILEWKEKIDP